MGRSIIFSHIRSIIRNISRIIYLNEKEIKMKSITINSYGAAVATPWNEVSGAISPDMSIEQWQKSAKMDWEIKSSPVAYGIGDGEMKPLEIFEGQNVLYRSDNHAPLSVVSDKYQPVQPKEVLEFFRTLVDENGFEIETAGTLRKGKRMWALAKTGKFAEVCKDDGIGGYLLLSTSCDRTLATTARFTTVRVICQNTLSVALKEQENMVSFSHLTQFDHEAVKMKLGKAVDSFGSFIDMAKYLQDRKLGVKQADAFVKALVSGKSQIKREDYDLANNRAYKSIMNLFESESKGNELVGHSKWGMLNAVTEYVDHHSPNRSQDARLDKAWFGSGELLKKKAQELLLV